MTPDLNVTDTPNIETIETSLTQLIKDSRVAHRHAWIEIYVERMNNATGPHWEQWPAKEAEFRAQGGWIYDLINEGFKNHVPH